VGDLIGYGPDPNEVIEIIKSQPNLTCLLGNHDAAVIGNLEIGSFNFDARKSILWTQSFLNKENIAFLKELPTIIELGKYTLVHGSPRFHLWEYLIDVDTAAMSFDALRTDFCVMGHSHIPIRFTKNSGEQVHPSLQEDGEVIHFQHPTIINPGSVGQPRDQDPRAAYAILDRSTDTWIQHRVEYDIPAVQQRIHQAGLSARHAMRLSDGW
jgi:diadenosine tetraphosphatase ApaH/serine/threonine PP2A family protein phosphatase